MNNLDESNEPSGVLASPPPIEWQSFGKHAIALEKAFGDDTTFNLWLMCSIESDEDFKRLLNEMEESGDPVSLIRAKLAEVLRTA